MFSQNRAPVTIASRTALIMADVILIVVTWRYTWPEWKRLKRANLATGGIGISMHGVLLRDGKSFQSMGLRRVLMMK